jgi:hypothetical protein
MKKLFSTDHNGRIILKAMIRVKVKKVRVVAYSRGYPINGL